MPVNDIYAKVNKTPPGSPKSPRAQGPKTPPKPDMAPPIPSKNFGEDPDFDYPKSRGVTPAKGNKEVFYGKSNSKPDPKPNFDNDIYGSPEQLKSKHPVQPRGATGGGGDNDIYSTAGGAQNGSPVQPRGATGGGGDNDIYSTAGGVQNGSPVQTRRGATGGSGGDNDIYSTAGGVQNGSPVQTRRGAQVPGDEGDIYEAYDRSTPPPKSEPPVEDKKSKADKKKEEKDRKKREEQEKKDKKKREEQAKKDKKKQEEQEKKDKKKREEQAKKDKKKQEGPKKSRNPFVACMPGCFRGKERGSADLAQPTPPSTPLDDRRNKPLPARPQSSKLASNAQGGGGKKQDRTRPLYTVDDKTVYADIRTSDNRGGRPTSSRNGSSSGGSDTPPPRPVGAAPKMERPSEPVYSEGLSFTPKGSPTSTPMGTPPGSPAGTLRGTPSGTPPRERITPDQLAGSDVIYSDVRGSTPPPPQNDVIYSDVRGSTPPPPSRGKPQIGPKPGTAEEDVFGTFVPKGGTDKEDVFGTFVPRGGSPTGSAPGGRALPPTPGSPTGGRALPPTPGSPKGGKPLPPTPGSPKGGKPLPPTPGSPKGGKPLPPTPAPTPGLRAGKPPLSPPKGTPIKQQSRGLAGAGGGSGAMNPVSRKPRKNNKYDY